MSIYRIKAPAKLNIRLKVIDRRPDGYHEIVSIMVPVDLFDLLELKAIPEKRIELFSAGYSVPNDERNLAYKAAQSFFDKTGIQKGISINLLKKIPVAAGLGGGSSDAAAVLLSLNEMWPNPLGFSDLHSMAVRLGADVPFFLHCRPSLARGIGEILEPLEGWPRFWYVIVSPQIQVPTSWVYQNIKLELTAHEYDSIIGMLREEDFRISKILENDLEGVTSSRFPIINTIKKLLVDAGAEGAMMTGSGPSVFGVFPSADRAVSAKQLIISQGLGDVFVATDWRRK
ncbi:MAG: 4-(cytidine 5'-diphospho)-2-C-methyl-D-erythritol kinase [Pseudomonadota bacterium]